MRLLSPAMALVATLATACQTSTPPRARATLPAPLDSPCDVAAGLLAVTEALEHAGQLERVVREAERAVALCPARALWAEPVKARAALALREPGDARVLFAEGLRARRRGETGAAQRAIDRARALLEAETGKKVHVQPGSPLTRVAAFRFADDGARLVFVRDDGDVYTLDVATLRLDALAHTLPGARRLDLAPAGTGFAVATDDRVSLDGAAPVSFAPLGFSAGARGFAVHDGREVRVLGRSPGPDRVAPLRAPLASFRFAPHGDAAAMALSDGTVDLWDLARDTHATFDAIRDRDPFAWSPDGRALAVRKKPGWPSGVVIVDVARGKVLHTLLGTRCDNSTAVAWSPDARWLVVGGGSIEMCLWDLAGPRVRETFDLPLDRKKGEPVPPVRLLAFMPNGAGLLAGATTTAAADRADVNLYRMPSAERLSSLGLRAWPRAVEGGSLLLAGDDRASVIVRPGLDVEDLRVSGLATPVSADGGLAVVAGMIVAADSGRRLVALEGADSGETFVFGPRGDVVASAERGVLRVWDVASGKLLVGGVDVVPVDRADIARGGGSIVVAGAGEGRAWVWDLGGRETSLRVRRRHDGGIALAIGARSVATIYRFADAALVVAHDGVFEAFGDGAAASRFVTCELAGSLYPADLCVGRFDGTRVLEGALGR